MTIDQGWVGISSATSPPVTGLRSRKLRKLVVATIPFLPWGLARLVAVRLLGWELARTARIGFSLVSAERVRLGEGARIGHFTVIRAIDAVEMDEHSKIGDFNWISGIGSRSVAHFRSQPRRRPQLRLGRHAAITGRHLIDCCDTVSIGEFSTLAGARTQILTHSIDISTNRQRSASVSLGRYCFIGTGSIILSGAVLPDFSVLAAGSVLTEAHQSTYSLYAGQPARRVKALSPDSAYFTREVGRVD